MLGAAYRYHTSKYFGTDGGNETQRVSSMLENFNVAEDVVKTAANSAGSALKENEK